MTITLDGIKIEVTKKKMKSLRIRVTAPDAKVLVSAPLHMSSKEIERFVFQKLNWIKSAVQKVKSAQTETQKSDEQRLKNMRGILDDLLSNPTYSSVVDEKLFTLLENQLSADEAAKTILEKKLTVLIPLWEGKTGLYCKNWKIKKVKSYWGKCNCQTRELFFSLRLAEQNDSCIEYVVLHELSHIKYPNHGKEFHAYLLKHMPNYKEIQRKMNSF